MSSSRQVPDETEDAFSVFPSESDNASSRHPGDLFAANENSFSVFPSEDESEMACGGESEGPPAAVSLAKTWAKSVSASRVFLWPLLIAAAGMFAVERASVRWGSSKEPKSAATSQAVTNLQGPRVPAPLREVPANPAATAPTRVPSITVPLSTIARRAVAPIPSARPLESAKGDRNDLAPDAANALRSLAAEAAVSVEAHLPESPPPVPVAEVTPVPAAPMPVAPVIVDAAASDRAAIDRVLGTYQQSYSSLDAGMVSTIWRGLDTRGLQRAFNGLDSQRMSFEHCDVHVGGDTAKASCTGVLDYVRKIGQPNPLQKRLSWNFELQRTGDRWLISGVDAR